MNEVVTQSSGIESRGLHTCARPRIGYLFRHPGLVYGPLVLDRSLIVDMLRAQRQSRLWNKVSTDMYMEPSGGQALLPKQKHEVLVFVCDLRSPMSPQSPVTYDNQINTEPASQYRSQCPECTMPKMITRYPSASQIIAHDSKEE
jgi:hypothetical protein